MGRGKKPGKAAKGEGAHSPPSSRAHLLAGRPTERFLTGKGMALQQMRVVTPGICLLPLSLLALVALSNIDWPSVDGQFTSRMDGAGFSSGGLPGKCSRASRVFPTPWLSSILQLLQLQGQGSRGSDKYGQSCAPEPSGWGAFSQLWPPDQAGRSLTPGRDSTTALSFTWHPTPQR